MKLSYYFSRLLFLLIIPSVALYTPLEASYVLQPKETGLSVDHFFAKIPSIDALFDLIEKTESGELEDCCDLDELLEINHFLARVAREGILPSEIEKGFALEEDIEKLLVEVDDYFSLDGGVGFSSSFEYSRGDLQLMLCQGWFSEKWEQTKQFVSDHKKEIIIGIVVVAGAAVVVGVGITIVSAITASAAVTTATTASPSTKPVETALLPKKQETIEEGHLESSTCWRDHASDISQAPPLEPPGLLGDVPRMGGSIESTYPLASGKQEGIGHPSEIELPRLQAIVGEEVVTFKESLEIASPLNREGASWREKAKELSAGLAHEVLEGLYEVAPTCGWMIGRTSI